jgi:uncharacterized repeat protein (TIGR01451 family)
MLESQNCGNHLITGIIFSMKKLLGLILAAVISLTVAGTISAAGTSNCQIVYGGGEVCQEQIKFTINKLVQKPGKGGGDYVDNLTVNDPRLTPGQNVNFKIVIENTGNSDIKNLNVVDRFPQYLSFVAGVGNANAGASEVNFVIGELKKGQKVEYVITAKAADANSLPNNQAVTCVTNNVRATSPDGQEASDNSQVCIEKQVLGVTPAPQIMEKPQVEKIPSTGPELAYLFGLIPTGLAGIYLKRKTN